MGDVKGGSEEIEPTASTEKFFEDAWREAQHEARGEVRRSLSYGREVPGGMTESARRLYEEAIQEYARQLLREAVRVAAEETPAGSTPEITASATMQASNKLRGEGIGIERPMGKRSILSLYCVAAGIGVGVMSGFLHSPWQWLVFIALAVTLVFGIAWTWVYYSLR